MSVQIFLSLHIAEGPVVVGGGSRVQAILQHHSASNENWSQLQTQEVCVVFCRQVQQGKIPPSAFSKKKRKKICF